MRALALILCMMALAAPASAAGDLPPAGTDWAAKLLAAVEGNGCAMRETDAALLLTPLGFEQSWTPTVLQGLIASGQAALDQSGPVAVVTVTSETCGASQ